MMEALLELLKLADQKPEEFDQYVYSVADTVEDSYVNLKDQPYQTKQELVAGYQVAYGYRMIKEMTKGGAEQTHVEIEIYTIFNFLGNNFTNNINVLQEVKSAIGNKLKSNV